jgi:FERM domain-containing protein 8
LTFLQFSTVENGIAVTKLMQIFSRQAAMMDSLVSHFAEQMRRRKEEPDPIENSVDDGKI